MAHNRGRIIEENHYYAYGLKIAGISSKKLPDANEGNIDNKNLYNDKKLFDDGDLNWYDYGFRNYDPQIGRFVQLDPLTDDYPELSPYQYAGCEPITNVDIDGLEPLPTVSVTGFLKHTAQLALPAAPTVFKGGQALTLGTTNAVSKVVSTSLAKVAIELGTRVAVQVGAHADHLILNKKDNALNLSNETGFKPKSTSLKGIQFIMDYEDYGKNLYNDDVPIGHSGGVGNATIGYGTKLHDGPITNEDRDNYPNGVTRQEAFILMMKELYKKEDELNKALIKYHIKLTQNQYDPVMSLSYNAGTGYILGMKANHFNPHLRRALISGVLSDIESAFREIKWFLRKISKGLVKRREEEINIFKNNVYDSRH